MKTVTWRDDAPLCLKEAEIEDASKMKIDWLIDIKELETTVAKDKSFTMDNVSIGSFRSQVYFSSAQSQSQDMSE